MLTAIMTIGLWNSNALKKMKMIKWMNKFLENSQPSVSVPHILLMRGSFVAATQNTHNKSTPRFPLKMIEESKNMKIFD